MAQRRYILGTSVKRLGDNRVGGYLVAFTDESQRDLHGEYFNETTDFILSNYPLTDEPMLYQHGFDDALGVIPIGRIKSVKVDGKGVYAEAAINFVGEYQAYCKTLDKADEWYKQQIIEAREYEEYIMKLVEDGLLSWSSGALPQGVKRTDDGLIVRWPMVEATLTPTPAEPRYAQVVAKSARYFERLFNGETARDTQKTSTDKNEDATMETSELKDLLEGMIKPLAQAVVEALAENGKTTDLEDIQDDLTKEAQEELDNDYKEENPDDEMKEMDEEYVEKWLNKKAASLVETVINRREQRARKMRDAARLSVSSVLESLEKMPANSPKASVGAPVKHNQQPLGQRGSNISVGENLKYAHLTSEQMALAIKLASAGFQKKHVTFSDLMAEEALSEEFLKTAVVKISRDIENIQAPTRRDVMATTDYHAVKSVRPFKADELNAVSIQNQGAEWTSVFYDTRLWERAREQTELFNLMSERGMRIVDIPQGARTMNVKLDTGSSRVYTVGEARNTDATGNPENVIGISPFFTDEVEEDPAVHMVATGVSYELEEDSIINVTSWVYDDNVRVLAEALESAMVNGDKRTAANTNINAIDGAVPSGLERPAYVGFNGIRLNYLVTAPAAYRKDKQNGSLDIRDFSAVRSLMPTAIRNRKNELLFVIDESVETGFRQLLQTLLQDTAGNQALAFTGDLFDPFGIGVYSSFALAPANTSGFISTNAANNTRGNISLVYAPYWQYGRKRAITVETERRVLSQTMVVGMSIRHAFRARGLDASAGMYNIAAPTY